MPLRIGSLARKHLFSAKPPGLALGARPGSGGIPVMTQPLFSAKCPPQKPRNASRRSREYLTAEEVEQLLRAARRQGRYKQRNATMILLMYRHGLRVAELVRLRWEMFDLKAALFHVQPMFKGRG